MEGVQKDIWQVVGASAVGVSHLRLDLPCQDACGWRSLPGGVLVMGVADGAGSAARSEEGARLALESALGALERRLANGLPARPEGWPALLREVFSQARDEVLSYAQAQGEPARVFAATLTLAIAAPQPELLVTAQVGDGAVAAVAADGADPAAEDAAPDAALLPPVRGAVLKFAGSLPVETALPAGDLPAGDLPAGLPEDGGGEAADLAAIHSGSRGAMGGAQVFPPFASRPAEASPVQPRVPAGELFAATALQRGEYANETHFLVEDSALEHLDVRVFLQLVSALAVMSDGLLRLALKLPSGEPHLPFFQPLFSFAAAQAASEDAGRQLAAFLSSERVNARTDDDKSLVIAVRSGASEGAA